MAELARGSVMDRPWGRTFATLGLRGITGQLTLAADGKHFLVAFEHGAVVAAASPLASDAAVRVALTGHLVSSSQVPEISRRQAASPERDEVDVIAELARLGPDHALRLRRRVIAQRAARTFSINHGDFTVTDYIELPIIPGCELDVRAVIYMGARTNLSEQRLAAELDHLGAWFQLKADIDDDLPQFGFTDLEQPVIERLRDGGTIDDLEAFAASFVDTRTVRAVVYALASYHACEVSAARPASAGARRATGSSPPVAPGPSQSSPRIELPVTGAATQPMPRFDAPAQGPPRTVTQPMPPSVTRPAPPDPSRAARPTPPGERARARKPTPGSSARRPTPSPPLSGAPTEGLAPSRTASPPRTTSSPYRPTAPTPPAGTSSLTPPGGRVTPPPGTHTMTPPGGRVTPPPGAHTMTPPGGRVTPPAGTSSLTPPGGRAMPPGAAGPPPLPTLSRTSTESMPTEEFDAPTQRDGLAAGIGTPEATRRRPPSQPVRAEAVRSGSTPALQLPPDAAGPELVIRRMPASRPPAARQVARTDSPQTHEVKALIAQRLKLLDQGADHFQLLGVAQDVSADALRKAYFALARQLHPDRLAALGISDDGKHAQRLFAQINTGFATLSSGPRRAQYLDVLRRGGEAVVRAEQARAEELTRRILEAEEAFRRGDLALRRDQPEAAVAELELAVQLNPDEADYHALLAWSQFCAAPDKMAIAQRTRNRLDQAIQRSPRAVTARFYLGRVERMLGFDQDALKHFRDILAAAPGHAEAAAEVRVLEARMAGADKSGGGVFGRNKR